MEGHTITYIYCDPLFRGCWDTCTNLFSVIGKVSRCSFKEKCAYMMSGALPFKTRCHVRALIPMPGYIPGTYHHALCQELTPT